MESGCQPQFWFKLNTVNCIGIALGIDSDQRDLAGLLYHKIFSAHLPKVHYLLLVQFYLDPKRLANRSWIKQNPKHSVWIGFLGRSNPHKNLVWQVRELVFSYFNERWILEFCWATHKVGFGNHLVLSPRPGYQARRGISRVTKNHQFWSQSTASRNVRKFQCLDFIKVLQTVHKVIAYYPVLVLCHMREDHWKLGERLYFVSSCRYSNKFGKFLSFIVKNIQVGL